MTTVDKVEVDLTDDNAGFPRKGDVQIMARYRIRDKQSIDHAAIALGMTQAVFVRTVLVRAAKKVLEAVDHPFLKGLVEAEEADAD